MNFGLCAVTGVAISYLIRDDNALKIKAYLVGNVGDININFDDSINARDI
jgi:hypothetical protein